MIRIYFLSHYVATLGYNILRLPSRQLRNNLPRGSKSPTFRQHLQDLKTNGHSSIPSKTFRQTISAVHSLPVSDAFKEKILGKNAANFLGLT